MLKTIILKSIELYQKVFSPVLGKHCRFWPSCSKYSYQAIQKYGTLNGIRKGFNRILRCHPWNRGRIDIP